MRGTITLLLCAVVALTSGATIKRNKCLNPATVNILLPHKICSKYYQCDDGKYIVRNCPVNLVFNVKAQLCDYPYNVKCKFRNVEHIKADEVEKEEGKGNGYDDPSKAPAICATDNSDGLLIAHENCNQFYKCANEKPVALWCPQDLFFNPDKDQCDWPQNVNCDGNVATSPIPDPQSTESGSGEDKDNSNIGGGNCDPSEAPSICAADDSDGILVAHENCNQFYKCSGGKPVAFWCAENLFFNPDIDQCDWQENVDCDRGVAPIPDPEPENGGAGNDDPSQAPSICAADNSDGVLVAHENCNQFYKCSAGKPVAMWCPSNLFFNPNKDQCDWPENVDCDRNVATSPVPDSQTTENAGGENNTNIGGGNSDPSEAPSICAADDSDGILIAHENCNQFYKCSGGKPVAFWCPANLFFNPDIDQCDWQENVDCDRGVVPIPDPEPENGGAGNNDPSQAPSICAAEDSDGVLIAHENCNQFYKCFAGKPVAMWCPSNLFFNPDKDQCDWPENVDCDRNIATSPVPDSQTTENAGGENNTNIGGGNSDPSEAPSICAADDSDGILVAHENCNQFYKCSGGKPVAFWCPANLFFNPDIDQCDWQENVDCDRGVAPIPDPEPENGGAGNNDPSQAPSICAAEDSDGVLIAHENCNQFYKCFAGKPVAMWCPSYLFFNPDKDQCDWPENVDCDRNVATSPVPDSQSTESAGGEDNTNIGGGNSDPSEAPSICAADDSDGILVAHENCNQFYKCSAGKPVAFWCPANLFFNPNIDQCDWQENVDCDRGVAPIPDPEPENGGAGNDDPTQAPSICAADNSDGVLIAHENCNQFYKCWSGKPVAMWCPSNLFFNPDRDQCDWPENVNCDRNTATSPVPDSQSIENGGGKNSSNTGEGNSDPSEALSICAADDSDGILVAHENCNQFYKCSGGKPVALWCPAYLFFNPDIDQCDWQENVDCDRGVAPIPDPEPENGGAGNDDPTQAPSICAAEDSDGVLIAHENCNQFYKCFAGKPVAMWCPSNLFFNPEKDQCDWPENVDCDRNIATSPVPDSQTTENAGGENNTNIGGGNSDPSEAPSICAADDSDGILVAHENCNQFYKCSGGKPVAFWCPANLFFNPDIDQCDWQENVDCDRGVAPIPDPEPENGGAGNDDPTQAPSICAAEDSDGVLIAHENCNQFYKCFAGKPVAMWCPSNLFFNPDKDQCDWPENVDCDRNIATSPVPDSQTTENAGGENNTNIGGGNSDPSEAPSICAADDSDGILVAHENCNQFYKCSGGKPVAFWCPANLFFNPDIDQCDWQENVDCDRGVAPIPDPEPENGGAGNDDPSQAPSICAAEDSDGVLIAHENCNQFYKCFAGKPVAMWCPSNLFFNPDKDQRDWPENVDCDRNIATSPVPDSQTTENAGGENNTNIGGGNSDPSEAPSICAADDSDGILVAHENCNQFYKCSGGKPVAFWCPANLFFNPDIDQCDWQENVDCDRGVAPIPDPEPENGGAGNNDPSQAPSICAAEDSDGVLIAHENCNQFYKCFAGKPVAIWCPSNLFFNPDKDQCDWPENVDCNRNVATSPVPDSQSTENTGGENNTDIGGGNSDPSEAPSICAADDSDGILVAHENCNRFYKCSGGKPVALWCPSNLYFNPKTDRCDWQENVDCVGTSTVFKSLNKHMRMLFKARHI